MMKFKELENKSVSELNQLLNDLRAESFTLGWKNKTQQQDQTHKIKEVRRNIARILTALKQKELSEKVNSQEIKNNSEKKSTKKSQKNSKGDK